MDKKKEAQTDRREDGKQTNKKQEEDKTSVFVDHVDKEVHRADLSHQMVFSVQPEYLLAAFLSHRKVLDLYGWGIVSATPQHTFNTIMCWWSPCSHNTCCQPLSLTAASWTCMVGAQFLQHHNTPLTLSLPKNVCSSFNLFQKSCTDGLS